MLGQVKVAFNYQPANSDIVQRAPALKRICDDLVIQSDKLIEPIQGSH